jgi:hypothetical protein
VAQPLDRLRAYPERGSAGPTGGLMRPDVMAEWLRSANPVVLTDDYAPADNLMASIFIEGGL